MKNIFKQEKTTLQLTFNPGLTLTGFRTTRPRRLYLTTVYIYNLMQWWVLEYFKGVGGGGELKESKLQVHTTTKVLIAQAAILK